MGNNPRIIIYKLNAAVILAAVFFFFVSCSVYSQKIKEPVFYYNNKIYQFTDKQNIKELFSVSNGTRNRAISVVPGGFVIWDKTQSKLKLYNSNGKIVSQKKFASGQVWINKNLLFCNDFIYTPDSGFEYSAWSFKTNIFFHSLSLKKIWSIKLDCFNSDILFEENGIIILAGKEKENPENDVYVIDAKNPQGKPVKIFSYPKNGDFTRLVHCNDKLVLFNSHKDKSSAPFTLYDADFSSILNSKQKINFTKHTLELPDSVSASCMYGFGFSFDGDLVLPFASGFENTAPISLLSFSNQNDSWVFKNEVQNCGGCYVYLGYDIVNNGVWYLAHDVSSDSKIYGSAFYDGNSVLINTLQ